MTTVAASTSAAPIFTPVSRQLRTQGCRRKTSANPSVASRRTETR